MSEEYFRKIAKEYAEMYFTKGIDSTKIFKYVDELEKEVEQLENIRKEAIEYVRNNFQQNIITGGEYLIGYSPCTDLLNILNKGSDK